MVLDYWEQSILPFLRACVALLIVFLSGVDASVKFRPHEVEELGPDFEEVWKKDYAQKPDKPLFWMSALAGYACASFILRFSHKSTADFPQISRRYRQSATSALEFLSYVDSCAIEFQVIALSCRGILFLVDICTSLLMIYMLLPTSTAGSCLSELHASLCACLTYVHFYSPADVAVLRWGYKRAREILRRMPVYRGAFAPAHPHFDADSLAGIALAEDGPVPLNAPKIVYSKKDDDAIDANIRSFGTSASFRCRAPLSMTLI